MYETRVFPLFLLKRPSMAIPKAVVVYIVAVKTPLISIINNHHTGDDNYSPIRVRVGTACQP